MGRKNTRINNNKKTNTERTYPVKPTDNSNKEITKYRTY